MPYSTILALTNLIIFGIFSPLSGQQKQTGPIEPEDYGKWESIVSGELSPTGQWLAVQVSRVNEKNELQIHRLKDGKVITVKSASNPTFSKDGEWIAYTLEATEEGDSSASHKEVGYTHLSTGKSKIISDIQSFSFSGRTDHLLAKRYPVGEDDSFSTVIVQNLSEETAVTFADVTESSWQVSGDLLAFATEGGGVTNSVQLYDPELGVLHSLDTSTWQYSGLQWRDGSEDLAFFRSMTHDSLPYAKQTIVVCTQLDTNSNCNGLDQSPIAEISAEYEIVSYRPITWSEDGSSVFFGVKPSSEMNLVSTDDTVSKPDFEKVEVEIWNSFDRRVIPEQKRDSLEDRQRTDLAVWHLDENLFIVLTDQSLENPRVHARGKIVTATDQSAFAFSSMFGRPKEDVHVIDPSSGKRLTTVGGISFPWQVSPTGKHLSYFRREAYHIVDLSSGIESTISSAAITDFNNREFDHPVEEKPPFGFGGWSKDGQSIIVYDKYDIWQLDLAGSTKKLTNGSTNQIIHRYINLGDEEWIDLEKDLYFSLRGEWTLNHGFARFQNGTIETLRYEDNNLSRLSKATETDVYAYIAQDFDDPPDYFVSNPSLRETKQVTNINKFQDDYDWGRSELIQYKNHRGKQLQGALFYPASYDPSQTYPMITYIYEKRSQTAKQYTVPSERSYYNWTVWTSLGYFVWQPDIIFDARDPGISSTQTMELSIQAIINKDVGVDPGRVGLIGHSWGGYQTAFAVTNTDIFAAAIAGAPLTNLISMYGSIFWSSSQPESGHFETGQERMEVPYWEDLDAYVRNSAVFNVEKLNTPLMLEVGDADRNVDWRQSIEYFNAARRAGKSLIMVAYHDEDHGLRQKGNQVDYHRKILRWFGHYLKGEDPPDWITDPIPYLKQIRQEQEN